VLQAGPGGNGPQQMIQMVGGAPVGPGTMQHPGMMPQQQQQQQQVHPPPMHVYQMMQAPPQCYPGHGGQ